MIEPLPTLVIPKLALECFVFQKNNSALDHSSTLALENPMDRGDCLLSGDSHSLWYHKRPDMTEQLALNYTYIHLCMEVRVQNEIFPE